MRKGKQQPQFEKREEQSGSTYLISDQLGRTIVLTPSQTARLLHWLRTQFESEEFLLDRQDDSL